MREIIVVENEAGQRLDKLLHKILPNASTGFLYKMLRKKNIVWNGKKADGSEKIKAGDSIRLFLSEETFEKFAGKNEDKREWESYEKAYRELAGIRILYENEHVLFLHKPAGLLSQKAQPKDLSANEWMNGYLLSCNRISAVPGQERRPGFHPSICNRLDRNTSGIVICGTSPAGSREMNRLIRERSVRKFYRLFVKGRIQGSDRLTGFLQKDAETNRVALLNQSQYDRLSESEKKAYGPVETGYRSISNGFLEGVGEISLLEAELVTGKTHQIRAHFASIGHPLVGDYKYGDRQLNAFFREKFGVTSQLLHAYRLEFPVLEAPFLDLSGKQITDPVPEVFERIMEGAGI